MEFTKLMGIGASGFTGALSTEMNNRAARKREREARQWNLDQWHRQNEFNHPLQQMSRLQEANLNPHLIYGTQPSSATGNADTVHPAKAPPTERIEFEPLARINDFHKAKQIQATTDNLQEQNKVLQEDQNLKAITAAGKITENLQKSHDYGIAKELRETSIQTQKEALENLKQNVSGMRISNQINRESMNDQIMLHKLKLDNIKQDTNSKRKRARLDELEADLMKHGAQKTDNIFLRMLLRDINSAKSGGDRILDNARNYINNLNH